MPAFLLLVYIINIKLSCCTIQPTISNATADYYIASQTNLRTQSITCTTDECHIICDEKQSCQGSTIDASQTDALIIRCTNAFACNNTKLIHGPSDSISIECTAANSCSYASFQFNDSTHAHVNCRNNIALNQWSGMHNGSCLNATFFGQNTEDITVDCNGLDCLEAVFHVNSSDVAVFNMYNPARKSFTKTKIFGSHISNSLTVKCLHSESCRQNYIFCPHDRDCIIYCRGSTDPQEINFPCDNLHIFIPNADYEYLYFNTTSSGALYHGDIFCEDSASFSYIEYDSDRNRWGCRDFPTGCCPIMAPPKQNAIYCKDGPDTDCIVLCSPCKKDVIYGGNDKSLSVHCTGNGSCFGMNIICPYYSDTASCSILCDGVHACEGVIIDVDHLDSLEISCTSERACYGLRVYPLRQYAYPQINTLSWHCSNSSSCESSMLGYGMTVDTMAVQCTGFESCKTMKLSTNLEYTTVVSDPVVINTSFVINCSASMACNNLKANIISSVDAMNHIICDNPSVSLDKKGACYRAQFQLLADYNGGTKSYKQAASEWNVSCNSYDCQHVVVSFDLNITLYARCHGSGACDGALFQGQKAKAFHLQCEGDSACYQAQVRGPSYTELATNITCIRTHRSDTMVCSEMVIASRWLYLNNYIQLNCPSPYEGIGICDKIVFDCDKNPNYYHHQEQYPAATYLYYNKEDEYYHCQATNGTIVEYTQSSYCCPIHPFHSDLYQTTTYTASTTEAVVQSTEQTTVDDKDNDKKESKDAPDASAVIGAVIGIVFGVTICALIVWRFCFVQAKKREDKDVSLLHADSTQYVPPVSGNHVVVDNDTEMTSPQK